MENLKLEELLIRVDRRVPGRLRVDWVGLSRIDNPAERISPFLAQVLAEAREDKCFVEMHFESLEHFNAMTIATLIQLIHSARKAMVPLHIHYDGKLRWQVLSFEALSRAVQSLAGGGGPNVEFFSAPA